MLAQRTMQPLLRRMVGRQQALRLASPAAIATGRVLCGQKRLTATKPVTEHDGILAAQRLNRPVAPHLGIYQPQITWILSSLNRITGLTLSFSFYAFGAAYLVAPYVGLHLESAVLAASFASWPIVAKVMTKMFVALPFTFHSFNGIRHLIWDTATMITNDKVVQSGWAVVGLSTVSALALAVM